MPDTKIYAYAIFCVHLYRKSPTGSHVAYHWRWLVKWVHKPRLIWWKYFPDDRLRWLVSETQHFSIYVHLQAAAYRWGWLISWIMFSEYKLGRSPISRVASCRGLQVWILMILCMYRQIYNYPSYNTQTTHTNGRTRASGGTRAPGRTYLQVHILKWRMR